MEIEERLSKASETPHEISIPGGVIKVYIQPPENGACPTPWIKAYLILDPLASEEELDRLFGGDKISSPSGTQGFGPEFWTKFSSTVKMRLDLSENCPTREEVISLATQVVADIMGRYRTQRSRREDALLQNEVTLRRAGW